ncbi:MAG TPA: hypothetical protein PLJ35_01170 [Anaerolineae bacterium]|nr:hypothetical protein [Anaerolineae bacterium]HPL27906.1 hypothetical protein [Anaerolineae bacterium]
MTTASLRMPLGGAAAGAKWVRFAVPMKSDAILGWGDAAAASTVCISLPIEAEAAPTPPEPPLDF